MNGVALMTVPTDGPADLGALEALDAGGYARDAVLAVVGKTEGNGCVNDFSRELAAAAWSAAVPPATMTVFSGGTEGVLSPHVNLLVRDDRRHDGFDRGLVAAVGETGPVPPVQVGRAGQLHAVADVVAKLCAELDVTADDVHLVLVKCPLLTTTQMAALHAEGHTPVVDDTYESMARSRAASALGTALGLGETDAATAEAALAGEASVSSARASASAGAELDDCQVLVLAESSAAANPLRALHGEMTDALDLAAVSALLDEVARRGGAVRQIFAKAEADPSGAVRGHRHTMLTDSDVPATRHARAAVGGLLAAVRGHGAVYVSGGAEHQGRPGGGSVTVVYELPGGAR